MQTLTNRFEVFHGLRGVAAVVVAFSHAGIFMPGNPELVPQGHLAVDLFFVLSGFVIAHAYDERLRKGLSFRDFAVARIVRLYPLYALSLCLAVMVVIGTILTVGMQQYSRLTLIVSFIMAPFFFPSPPQTTIADLLFPLNGPTWSLFFELAVNAAYGLVAVRLDKRAIGAVIIVSFAVLLFTSLQFGGLGGGARWDAWWVGIPRVVFSFSVGLFMRRYMFAPARESNLGACVLFAACVAFMMVPADTGFDGYYDLLAIALIWPAVVLIAARLTISGLASMLSDVGGEASYGIYVLHTPMLGLLSLLTGLVTGANYDEHSIFWVICCTVLIVVASTLLNDYFDKPARKALLKKFGRRPVVSGVTQF